MNYGRGQFMWLSLKINKEQIGECKVYVNHNDNFQLKIVKIFECIYTRISTQKKIIYHLEVNKV